MTLFEPLFIAVLVALFAGVLIGAFRWGRGNRTGAIRLLKKLCLWVTVYMTIDITVGLASSREFHKAGDIQCYDDWCIRPLGARRTHDGLVEVSMELSSRARQVPQGERGTFAYLLDLEGHRYDALSVPRNVPFHTLLQPGQTAISVLQFRIPAQLGQVHFVYEHSGFPIQLFIIGQAGSWIYGPPITLLDVL